MATVQPNSPFRPLTPTSPMPEQTIDLARHLRALLYEYNPVVVPNLGAFSTHHKSAQLDEEKNILYPPSKTLSFDDQNKQNDGLLISHIARSERISELYAEDLLNEVLSQLLGDLAEGKVVHLVGIGELYRDTVGIVQLMPEKKVNFSTDSFGLMPVSLSSQQGADGLDYEPLFPETPPSVSPPKTDESPLFTPEIDASAVVPPPISSTLLESLNNTQVPPVQVSTNQANKTVNEALAQTAINPSENVLRNRQRRGSSIWLWLLPLFILLFFGFMLSRLSDSGKSWYQHRPFSWFIKDTNENIAQEKTITPPPPPTPLDTSAIDHIAAGNGAANASEQANLQQNNTDAPKETYNTQETSPTSVPSTPITTTTNATDNTNTQAESDLPPGVQIIEGLRVTNSPASDYANKDLPKGYYIILGSFKTMPKANELIAQMRQSKLIPRKLETLTGNLRIGVLSASDIPSVKKQYTQLRQQYPDAWVLRYN